jgi:hypothetical protein
MGVLAEAVIAAFDSNAAITWTTDGPSIAIASFTNNGFHVSTRFSRISNEEWQVGFEVITGQQTGNEVIRSSIRIFSGVFQSVREFLEVRQPMRLVFTSKEESLGSLYESYLERQDTTLAQLRYTMETPSKAKPLTEFVIRKKTPSEWKN